MATDNNYAPNSIIGKYISSCEQVKAPLNETQIGLLEKTLNKTFGITTLPKLSSDVFRPMDTLHITGRLENVLREYREKNLEVTDDLPLSEADAWSLYSLTANEIEKTTFKEIKEKHNLPSNYGFTAYKYLHEYFVRKGFLPPKTKFRMPKN
ncbi:MAG: hypothetical protein WC770_03960 [Phycisphaerae bacterium]|jgi:hypothetical protein